MNLIIDIGNSLTKIAIFDEDVIVKKVTTELLSVALINDLKETFPAIEQAILSSVTEVPAEVVKSLNEKLKYFIQFSQLTPVPIVNCYESPTTLGLDRIAAAVGSTVLFPAEDRFIIDAGTAITFDLIDRNDQFLGGNISPGLKTRFRALHEFTGKLPMVEASDQWVEIGKTTEEAIRAGVQKGLIFEIDGMIDQIREKWKGCRIILTGGDSFFFETKLKNAIFVIYEITLVGLNKILEYNAKRK